MSIDRIREQIRFIVEVDKLKKTFRRTSIIGESRRENDAEHSWHFALMAIILAEHSREKIDVLKAVKMALMHDIVEIDAGDVFLYGRDDLGAIKEQESRAAERLFGMLPEDQAGEMIALWNEFEERKTPEAKFAAAIDRLQPMLLNYYNDGGAWKEHNITSSMVTKHNRHMGEGAPELWSFAEEMIRDAVEKGLLGE